MKKKSTIDLEFEYEILKKFAKKFDISDYDITGSIKQSEKYIEKILFFYNEYSEDLTIQAINYVKLQIDKIEEMDNENYKFENMQVSEIIPFFHMVILAGSYPLTKYLLKKNIDVNQLIEDEDIFYPLDQLLYRYNTATRNFKYVINKKFDHKIFEVLLSYGGETYVTQFEKTFIDFFEESCRKYQKNIEEKIFHRIYKKVKQEGLYQKIEEFYNLYMEEIIRNLNINTRFLKKYNNISEIKQKAKEYFLERSSENSMLQDIVTEMDSFNFIPSASLKKNKEQTVQYSL